MTLGKKVGDPKGDASMDISSLRNVFMPRCGKLRVTSSKTAHPG